MPIDIDLSLDAGDLLRDTGTGITGISPAELAALPEFAGSTPATITGTTDTLDAADNQRVNRYTAATLVTITIPNTLAVGSEGFLAASGAAGIAVDASTFTTVDGTASVGQGGGLYWKVIASGVLLLRGGEVSSGGGDMVAANNLSDLTNAATARTNLNVDIAGTAATAVSDHDALASAHGVTFADLLDTADFAGLGIVRLIYYTDATAASVVRPSTAGPIIWANTTAAGTANPTAALANDIVVKKT